MWKKLLAILLAVLMTLPALAEETPLETHAAQLTRDMALQAADGAYLAMYMGSAPFSGNERLQQLLACTWEQPLCDVYLTVDGEMMGDMLTAMGGMLQADYVMPFILFTLDPQMDQEALIIRSCAQTGVTYIDPAQPDGLTVFVRFYDDGVPVLFCLHARDSAVVMTAMPLTGLPELPAGQEAESLQGFFAESGSPFLFASETPQPLLMGRSFAPEGDTMAQRAVSLAQEAGRRMNDPEHRAMFGLSPESEALMAEWGGADYGAPRMVLALQLDPWEHGVSVWGMEAAEVLSDADSPAARRLTDTVNSSYFSALVARSCGVEVLVAQNSTRMNAFCADPAQPDGTGAFLLFYEGGRVMLVSWIAQNGVVDMGTEYLPIDGLGDCANVTEAESWFIRNADPVTLTQIIPE